jgi:hypothetical protein
MKKKLLFLVWILFVGWLQGQTPLLSPYVVNTTGGTMAILTGGFVEFSVGEPAITTLNIDGNPLGFTQGVLQPILDAPYVITSTHESFDDQFGFRCYPNPVSNWITVETSYLHFTSVQFYDPLGRLVDDRVFNYQPLDCSSLPTGLYFVRLFSNNKPESKTFKIIKQ